MTSRVTILGCGASGGVPLIGNSWGVCDPAEPHNRRMRPSIYVQHDDIAVIVDTGQDFKNQINNNNFSKLDAVLYTHCHADHVSGIDELYYRCRDQKLRTPIYTNSVTLEALHARYDYMFGRGHELYPQLFDTHLIQDSELYHSYDLYGVPVTLFEQDHGTCISLGLRFGNFGYSTDMKDLDDRAIDVLRGVDVWIADANSMNGPMYTHANVQKVIELNQEIGARQVYLTHMPPTMDYRTLLNELPPGYAPAYDGLQIEVTV